MSLCKKTHDNKPCLKDANQFMYIFEQTEGLSLCHQTKREVLLVFCNSAIKILKRHSNSHSAGLVDFYITIYNL